jgi:PQQ-like domain
MLDVLDCRPWTLDFGQCRLRPRNGNRAVARLGHFERGDSNCRGRRRISIFGVGSKRADHGRPPGGTGDLTATHVVWRNLRGGPHVPSPLYRDGRLYIVNDTGIATCLDALDGHTMWQHRLRGRFSMSPVGCRDRILVTNEEGHSTIFKAADQFEVLAENDLDEPQLATPALVGDRLYFRSAAHLWCIGRSETGAVPTSAAAEQTRPQGSDKTSAIK